MSSPSFLGPSVTIAGPPGGGGANGFSSMGSSSPKAKGLAAGRRGAGANGLAAGGREGAKGFTASRDAGASGLPELLRARADAGAVGAAAWSQPARWVLEPRSASSQ